MHTEPMFPQDEAPEQTRKRLFAEWQDLVSEWHNSIDEDTCRDCLCNPCSCPDERGENHDYGMYCQCPECTDAYERQSL